MTKTQKLLKLSNVKYKNKNEINKKKTNAKTTLSYLLRTILQVK